VKGVAQCELSLALGVPVLQAAALSVLKQVADAGEAPVDALAEYFVMGARLVGEDSVVDVSWETRLSFERAFGLSPFDQLLWEQSFDGVRVGHAAGVIEMPPPSRWFDAHPGLYEPVVDSCF